MHRCAVDSKMAGVSTKRRPKASLENKGLQNEDPLENEDLKDPLKILSVMQKIDGKTIHLIMSCGNNAINFTTFD